MITQYISQEGLDKLKNELEERKGSKRIEITKRIAEAKELGDLSENAEYAEAREEQGMNEGRIEEIQGVINSAVIVDNSSRGSKIAVGSTIVAKVDGDERTFTIVGANEAEPSAGFISNESPIGLALIEKEKGDEVEVQTPSGKVKYKIKDVK
ncbi:MAG: transcription elongation factor GreA [Parcubacteria group bacterium]